MAKPEIVHLELDYKYPDRRTISQDVHGWSKFEACLQGWNIKNKNEG